MDAYDDLKMFAFHISSKRFLQSVRAIWLSRLNDVFMASYDNIIEVLTL